MSKLKTLGPFAKAIQGVLEHCSDSDLKREDYIERGDHVHNPDEDLIDNDLGYFCRSFLLFRGSLINKEWIADWMEEIGPYDIQLNGFMGTTKNL